jgi:hypothetical protein
MKEIKYTILYCVNFCDSILLGTVTVPVPQHWCKRYYRISVGSILGDPVDLPAQGSGLDKATSHPKLEKLFMCPKTQWIYTPPAAD